MNDAVNTAVELALDSIQEKGMEYNDTDNDKIRKRDQVVDFHERYGTDESNNCCFFQRCR